MIHFLLLLAYYKLYWTDNIESYFQKFNFLEYGFKKNATYTINFLDINTTMVFGLATKKEIAEIEKIKDIPEFCTGEFPLSRIQYLISNCSNITGKIPTKGILIPYSFTCNKNYSFVSEFDYQNGKNHLDYRCQNSIIYTLTTLILFVVFTICYIIYIRYHFKGSNRQKLHTVCCVVIFVLYTIQVMLSFLFFITQQKTEYFNARFSKNDYYYDPPIISSPIDILAKNILFFSQVFSIAILSFSIFAKLNNCFCLYFSIICFSLSAISLIASNVCMMINDSQTVRFVTFVLSCAVIVFLLISPICSLLKCGIIVHFVGALIVMPFGSILFEKTLKTISTHWLILVFIDIYNSSMIISTIILLIAYCTKELDRFNDENKNNPFYTQVNNYTHSRNDAKRFLESVQSKLNDQV